MKSLNKIAFSLATTFLTEAAFAAFNVENRLSELEKKG